jgi:membrane protein implicated in regulation of membrane protease activity
MRGSFQNPRYEKALTVAVAVLVTVVCFALVLAGAAYFVPYLLHMPSGGASRWIAPGGLAVLVVVRIVWRWRRRVRGRRREEVNSRPLSLDL